MRLILALVVFIGIWSSGVIKLIMEWKKRDMEERQIKFTKQNMTTIYGILKFYEYNKSGDKIRNPKPFIVDMLTDIRYDLPETINGGIDIVERFIGKEVKIAGWVLPSKSVNGKIYHKFYIKRIVEWGVEE